MMEKNGGWVYYETSQSFNAWEEETDVGFIDGFIAIPEELERLDELFEILRGGSWTAFKADRLIKL